MTAPRLDGDCLAEREVALIEKAALSVGMKSLMNYGAASCVYSEGCNGVTQEHLIAFAREVAVHCATALAAPDPAPHEPAMLQGVEALLNEAYAHWDADREFKVGKILLALIGHSKGYDKRSDAFRAALSASKQAEQATPESDGDYLRCAQRGGASVVWQGDNAGVHFTTASWASFCSLLRGTPAPAAQPQGESHE